jgi:biotin carboxyl carrier protein
MPYISTVSDKTYRIDTGENGAQRDITIDGTRYTIDCRQIAPLAADAKDHIPEGGRYSIIITGQSYEVFVRQLDKPDEDGQTYEIFIAGQRFEVHVEDEREKALAGIAKAVHETGEAMVRAPMPGLVLRVPVEPGADVTRGQTVVVLEAMKMENDLASPIVGKVKEIRVKQGQTVNQGDVLVVVVGE